jgi:hypothetical protein
LEEAKAEFQRVAHLTLAAYPFPGRWRECWSTYISFIEDDFEPVKWMRELVPGLDSSLHWRKNLRRDFIEALTQVDQVLRQQPTHVTA